MRTHHRSIAIAVALATTSSLGAEYAQAQITYNLRTGSVTGEPLRSGRSSIIRVEGLNPLCYAHVARTDVVREAPDLKSFVAGMSTAPKQPDPVAPPAPAVLPPPPPAVETLAPAAPIQEKAIGAARSAALDGLLTEAANQADALERMQQTVAYVEDVASRPCGRDGVVAYLLNGWETTRDELARGAEERPRAQAAMDLALRHARDVIDGDNNTMSAAEQAVFDRHVKPLQERAARIVAQLAKSWGALEPSLPTLDLAASSRTIELTPPNDHDTKMIVLSVESTPRKAFPGVSPTPFTRSVSMPVRRDARAFLSTGVLITFMQARDYGRVNRPYAVKNSEGVVVGYADSTYSTFASQDRSAYDYFSPAVQFNTGLGAVTGYLEERTGVALMASFGLAARITNGATRAEPFLGVSTSVADRFVLTFGAHWTREEVLRITLNGESPADVEAREVPTAITERDAIGTQGRRSAFLSVSVKP